MTDADKIQTLWLLKLFHAIFPPTGVVNYASFERLEPDCGDGIHAWIGDGLRTLDPNKHKQTFATLLVIYLSIASELYPGQLQLRNIPTLKIKLPMRCPPSPDLFATNINSLHQPGSLGRLNKVVDTIGLIVEFGWSIDTTALVHLVERTTRDLTLAERAVTSQTCPYGGFSGLVVPLSWASSLVKHAKYPRKLRPQPLEAFVRYSQAILVQVLDGIPDHWRVLSDELAAHDPESLAFRLIWSIALVAINLHPAHSALPTVLSALKQPKGVSYVAHGNIPPRGACYALGDHGIVCPAKQGLTIDTITFEDISHLGAILSDRMKGETIDSNSSAPSELHEAREMLDQIPSGAPAMEATSCHESNTDETPLELIPVRPETPAPLPHPECQAESEAIEDSASRDKLTRVDAARRIQVAWSRATERRRQQQIHLISIQESRSGTLPEADKPASKKRIRALRLIQGSYLSIATGLKTLADQVGDHYLELGVPEGYGGGYNLI